MNWSEFAKHSFAVWVHIYSIGTTRSLGMLVVAEYLFRFGLGRQQKQRRLRYLRYKWRDWPEFSFSFCFCECSQARWHHDSSKQFSSSKNMFASYRNCGTSMSVPEESSLFFFKRQISLKKQCEISTRKIFRLHSQSAVWYAKWFLHTNLVSQLPQACPPSYRMTCRSRTVTIITSNVYQETI